MPSKANKKKNKSSKSAAKEANRSSAGSRESRATPSRPPNNLDEQFDELSKEWEASPQKELLIKQLGMRVLTQKGISIDNALCLGLGSMEKAEPRPLQRRKKSRSEEDDSWTADNSDDDELWAAEKNACRNFAAIGNGAPRNRSLHQLLVFETVLDCLRKKFNIQDVRFQDPTFTKTDREFLENRGHTVMDYDRAAVREAAGSAGGDRLDPLLTDIISSSKMCFLPFMDTPVVIEVICAAKPSLCLTNDLVHNIANPVLRYYDATKDLMDAYELIALSCEFESVEEIIGEDLGFIWQADIRNEKLVEKLTERNSIILNAELDRWGPMEEFLRKKREEKEMKVALDQSAKEKVEEDARRALETRSLVSVMSSLQMKVSESSDTITQPTLHR